MASRPSRSRMMAAWMKADDMNGDPCFDVPGFIPRKPQVKARGIAQVALRLRNPCKQRTSEDPRKLESFNSYLSRVRGEVTWRCQPPDLQHRKREHGNRGRLMRQREQNWNLIQQRQDAQ